MQLTADYISRKLSAYAELAQDEISVLSAMQGKPVMFHAGERMTYEGQRNHSAYVLCEGWALSCKEAHGTRQIIDVRIPGDILGMESAMLRASDKTIEALTDVVVRKIRIEDFLAVCGTHPRVGRAMMWAAARDQAMIVEHLVDVARRSSVERTAHFLLELAARLQLVGLGTSNGYDCPMSQAVLADTLGMTAIHLNRVLRQLREDKLLVFRDWHVTLMDLPGLSLLTGFDLAYLDQSNARWQRRSHIA